MRLSTTPRAVSSALITASLLAFCSQAACWAEADPIAGPIVLVTPLTGVTHSEQVINGKTFVVSKTLVNASPELVFKLVTDYSNAVKYFSNLVFCEVLSESNGVKLVRFKAKAAGFMRMDYILSIDQSKPNRIEWKRVKGSFKANQGYWDLTPVNGGKSTMITYVKHVDPGFLTPSFMVHKTLKDTADQIFRDLKKVAETPQLAKFRQE